MVMAMTMDIMVILKATATIITETAMATGMVIVDHGVDPGTGDDQ